MTERLFHLTEHQTSFRREVLSGLTTFLTMMYILFANSDILAECGMPWHGVFMATALLSAVCTILAAVCTNLPFAIAPGMGTNTVFAYTVCLGMNYHWKEALAICFLSGTLHALLMSTPLRKTFVNAFPEYLRAAAGAGLGMFIAYVGIKNMGILVFYSTTSQFGQMGNRSISSGSSTVPALVSGITSIQAVALIGLVVMVVLIALEKKTGERYAALPVGILVATFIGIPLNVSRFNVTDYGTAAMRSGFHEVFLGFFGDPGLLSLFSDFMTASRTILMVFILLMTSLLDSVGTMIGIGQVPGVRLFTQTDMDLFSQKGAKSRLDKSLIANSISNMASPLFGSSPSTIYLESVTGILAGGRTGLTGLVTGLLFLLCLPFANFFHIIPSEAVAPALILAGASMLTRIRHIDWRNFEESLPSFVTILFMPLAYNVLDGIALGITSHVIIRTAMGKRRETPLILFLLSAIYLAIKLGEHFYSP